MIFEKIAQDAFNDELEKIALGFVGKGALIGGAAGSVGGALGFNREKSPDGSRLGSAFKGAIGGAAVGAIGGKIFKPNKILNPTTSYKGLAGRVPVAATWR